MESFSAYCALSAIFNVIEYFNTALCNKNLAAQVQLDATHSHQRHVSCCVGIILATKSKYIILKSDMRGALNHKNIWRTSAK
jgi:hypothetical protein